MGSTDVLDWLINQRRGGVHSFFRTEDIKRGLENAGYSSATVYYHVRKLHDFGFLEVEVVNLTSPRWRVKEKYV
jgi:hypothetical protein